MPALARKRRLKNPSTAAIVGITIGVAAVAVVGVAGTILYRLMQK